MSADTNNSTRWSALIDTPIPLNNNASTRWSALIKPAGIDNNPSTRWSALLIGGNAKFNAGREGVLTIAPKRGTDYNGKISARLLTSTHTQSMQDKDGVIALLGDNSYLLATVNVPFDADADTDLYTVPAGKRLILTSAIIVVGDDATTTLLSIGQDGTETDFIDTNNLAALTGANYSMLLYPPQGTAQFSYDPGTLIQAQVTNNGGSANNTLFLFGFLY